MRNVTWAVFVCVAAAMSCECAVAQPGALPYTQPTVSPYINLGRRGASAVDYFGIVRPQLEFRNALRNLHHQSASSPLNVAHTYDPQAGFRTTGHVAVFMNRGGYFMNSLAPQPGHSPPASAPPRGPSAPAGLPKQVGGYGGRR